eukprot:CAMPEP_0182886688 /NCGR_PEP_ID=MMETSP0034_2-20130328/20373_1 /TAXON_ID=156128 /ORGANISM="Nephroselmis pyriformis, Strain CCMP717" /LENGTH=166 /DNA_ID=CAMNT_0025020027 /DNA_START=9 /DNA_END=507 /DNA_ORIENTATION=-
MPPCPRLDAQALLHAHGERAPRHVRRHVHVGTGVHHLEQPEDVPKRAQELGAEYRLRRDRVAWQPREVAPREALAACRELGVEFLEPAAALEEAQVRAADGHVVGGADRGDLLVPALEEGVRLPIPVALPEAPRVEDVEEAHADALGVRAAPPARQRRQADASQAP